MPHRYQIGSVLRLGLAAAGLAVAGFRSVHSAGPASPTSVVFFGDSLTAGYGLSPSEAYPALIQKKIDAQGWNARVVNAGLSGDTSSGALRRLNWVLRQNVDILVIEFGANDGLRGISPDVTKENLLSIIDRSRAKYPRVKIVLVGMQMPPNLGQDYTTRFRLMYPEIAKNKRTELVPFLLDHVAAHEDLNQTDRVHPNARGQEILADNVWKTLAPLLTPRA